ncbi:MAG: DUF4012 domain-containing protein [Bifidobacterium sp.]|nr:DUF4012 domain-containing protein [Bifidobacterium sp.]
MSAPEEPIEETTTTEVVVVAPEEPETAAEGADGNDGYKTAKPKLPWYKRIRWWGWTIIGVVVVIIGLGGAFGVQGLMIKDHEEKAISAVTSSLRGGDLSNLDEGVKAMQEETGKAASLAHSGLWAAAAHLPGLGSNVQSLQGMTAVAHSAAVETVPKYVDAVDEVPIKSLFKDGKFDVEPIVEIRPELQAANQSLSEQVDAYNAIPRPSIGILAKVYDQVATLLGEGLQTAQWGVNDVIPELPTWLGYKGTQTYAILAMTPAEERASGGLVGAIGSVSIDKGKIKVGEFEDAGPYIKKKLSAELTQDEINTYQTEGPLHMSYDVRDITNFADTQRIADEFKKMWDAMHEQDPVELSGVILADPVFVQTLVKVLGDVKLPDGQVLTGTNTADFLMNTVYKEYPVSEQNAYFGLVASTCVQRLMDHLDVGKLVTLARDCVKLAHNRHLNMWFYNEQLTQIAFRLDLVASIPFSETDPEVGVYLTEQNPSKMGWYIDRTAKVTEIDCGSDNADPNGTKYHVEYTLTNTMSLEESESLPIYITGMEDWGRGTGYEKILFYPPLGGTLSNFKVTGNGSAPIADTMNGRFMYQTLTQVQPGRSVTYSFDVRVSPKATKTLQVDQTPTKDEEAKVEHTKACPVE